MKRVLMIAFHYPPLRGSSGIQRTLAFSRDLRDFGWHPIVLAAHPRAYESTGTDQLRDIPEDVPVYRPFALDAARHLSIRGAYPKFLALPDRWSSWRLGGVASGLGIVRRHRPDVLWSTFPIPTAHSIGLGLSRLTGLPWVADFRDSMTEPHYPSDPTIRGARLRLERSTVRRASRVVFTTPGARCMYHERYPQVPDTHWAVIPNGFDEALFQEAERGIGARSHAGAPRVLVHSGILYPSERDPRAFFAAIQALRRAGRIDASSLRVVLRATGFDEHYRPMLRDMEIDDIVRLEPAIGYRDALAELLTADGLLIFQAANCNHQIPAKIYEYLRAGRPIFALTDARGDTAGELADAGIDTIVPIDSQARIADGLSGYLDALGRGTAPVASPDAVRRRSRHARAGELAALFDSIVGG